jgi:hypothetical protein
MAAQTECIDDMMWAFWRSVFNCGGGGYLIDVERDRVTDVQLLLSTRIHVSMPLTMLIIPRSWILLFYIGSYKELLTAAVTCVLEHDSNKVVIGSEEEEVENQLFTFTAHT